MTVDTGAGQVNQEELRSRAESFVLPGASDAWFDLWHTHVDWKGAGNGEPSARHFFLKLLLVVLHRVVQQAEGLVRPHQVWAVTHPDDSAQDAVYVHTPNPNQTSHPGHAPFPYPFAGVQWDAAVPDALAAVLDPLRHQVGRCQFEGSVTYWIRMKSSE